MAVWSQVTVLAGEQKKACTMRCLDTRCLLRYSAQECSLARACRSHSILYWSVHFFTHLKGKQSWHSPPLNVPVMWGDGIYPSTVCDAFLKGITVLYPSLHVVPVERCHASFSCVCHKYSLLYKFHIPFKHQFCLLKTYLHHKTCTLQNHEKHTVAEWIQNFTLFREFCLIYRVWTPHENILQERQIWEYELFYV